MPIFVFLFFVELNMPSCQMCNATFTSNFEVKLHLMKIHHETKYMHESFVCSICDANFDKIEYLKSHLDSYAHSQRVMGFERASKSKPTPKKLMEDSLKQSDNSDTNFILRAKFKCFMCKKVFYRRDYMVWHLSKKHSIDRPVMID